MGFRSIISNNFAFGILFLHFSYVINDKANFTLKSHIFKSPVYQLLWDKELEIITIGVATENLHFNKNLEQINSISSKIVSNYVYCPASHVKCEKKSITDDQILAMLLVRKNAVIDCGLEKKLFCRKFGPNTSWVHEIPVRHTNECKCSKKTSNTQNFSQQFTKELLKYEYVPSSTQKQSILNRVIRNMVKSKLDKMDQSSQQHSDLTLRYFRQTVNEENDSSFFFSRMDASTVFIHGFIHANWVYIVFTQTSDGRNFETRVLRVCENEQGMFSYTEIAIGCMDDRGRFYGKASAAYFSENVALLRGQVQMKNEMDLLYINFRRPDDSMHNESVLCMFPLHEIDATFNGDDQEIPSCELTNDPNNKNPGKLCTSKNKSATVLKGDIMAVFPEEGTSLAVTLQNHETVAFVGTKHGELMKFHLRRNIVSYPMYSVNLLKYTNASSDGSSSAEVRRSNTFDNDEENLFLLVGNSVVKFPVNSCIPYQRVKTCLSSPMPCGWCNNTVCTSREDCNGKFVDEWKQYSDPATLILEKPLNGPLHGGTTLTLRGNFSSYEVLERNEQVRFSIDDEECAVTKWTEPSETTDNLWIAECVTTKARKEYTGPVVLHIRDWKDNRTFARVSSKELFSYLSPKLFEVSPRFGPRSGGTHVTLYGENLNIGLNQAVSLSSHDCLITERSGNKISCITSPMRSTTFPSGSVAVWIDKHLVKAVELNTNSWMQFEYRMDPVITRVHPNSTIFSGKTNLTVSGRHLDSIAYPKLMVTIDINGEQKNIFEVCSHNGTWGYHLTCSTPSLVQQGSVPIPTANNPYRAEMTFIMDGVSHDKLFEGRGFKSTILHFYPDPVFYPFHDVLTEQNITKGINVEGYNLNNTLMPKDVKIIINESETCEVTELSFSRAHCEVDRNMVARLRKRDTSSYYPVKAIVANLSYPLGEILISKPVLSLEEDPEKKRLQWSGIIIGTSLAGFLMFVFIVSYIKMRKRFGHSGGSGETPLQGIPIHNYVSKSTVNDEEESTSILLDVPTIRIEIMDLLKQQHLYIVRERLNLENQIGEGQFGRVFKGKLDYQDMQKTRPVAVKTIKRSYYLVLEESDKLLTEGIMMKDIKHPNVLTLLGVCFDEDGIPMIILPYMEFGDLHSYLQTEDLKITVAELLDFGLQIAKGMCYLAAQRFVHRDLATRNCTLSGDMVVKISDFGLSRDVYERDYYRCERASILPIRWMAPEAIVQNLYTEKSDVWSFGVVLWELTTRGWRPYSGLPCAEVLQRIQKGHRLEQPPYCPNYLYIIMMKCWNASCKKRPCFQDLVNELSSHVTT